MATVYRIHPAIGIARLGNSPDEFFIGPERSGERPEPNGGFKDAECRVKRQAARFRIFAHHDDDTVAEITDAEAEIEWRVHVANRKAGFPGRGNSEPAGDLVIDPGPRSTDGPNQARSFDGGSIRFSGTATTSVPLGEMRTDTANRLLVLGGSGRAASPAGNGIANFWGNPGWYDDIADGAVSATIRLRSDNSTPAVEGAWVIVAPPKFAPHQDSITTLYDRLLQAMVDAGLAPAPASTSYTRDVHPLLQRTRDIEWVKNTHVHAWSEPVTSAPLRQAIFSRLSPGDMPQLAGSDRDITPIQRAHMERWKDDNYTNDWVGPPVAESVVTPSGMDRAALDACVGASFFPGIEAGGKVPSERPILDPANYSSAFRIDHGSVLPGTISASMALPWQADFYACSDSWWPVPRPGSVFPAGAASRESWTRGIGNYMDMVDRWHSLGFVVEQGDSHAEVERCDTASIHLLTPTLDFIDVPQGPMGMVREMALAITFEVISPSAAVTLEYAPGGAPAHPQLIPYNTSVSVPATSGSGVATARLWLIYRTGALNSSLPTQVLTVREPGSGQTWDITVDANTIARKTAGVALVLDRSGSMAEDRGDGTSKHASLQQAAETFVDLMLEGDGVGLVRYDHDAQPVEPVGMLGSGGLSDSHRSAVIDAIRGNAFDPAGATSIGDGLHEGRLLLDAASGTYDTEALVVLTDGKENSSRYIADVAADIDQTTYAIGLGTPQNTSAAALQNVSGNTGGHLLVTGAIDTDNRFRLQKYFLQVLAGVSNAEVVLDPDGRLHKGAVHRIPFRLSGADSGVDVILLSPGVETIDFRLQTPTGQIIEPWRAVQEPAMRFSLGRDAAHYRLTLPTQLLAGRYDHEGTWHVLLALGRPQLKPDRTHEDGIHAELLHGMHARPQAARSRPDMADYDERARRYRLAMEANAPDAIAAAAPAERDRTHEGAVDAPQRHGVPYSVIVHAWSSVSLRADIEQSGHAPGARIDLRATLTRAGIPLDDDAEVWAEVHTPGGVERRVPLERTDAGDGYHGQFVAGTAGTWPVRVRASGKGPDGHPFTRERSLTAVVWRGGDRDANDGMGPGVRELLDTLRERDQRLCALMACLLSRREGSISPELEKRLHEAGFDLAAVRKCLAAYCRGSRVPGEGKG
ncbi:VWA domain-containing protein [Lysobacter sp. SG-8]|uniref:VWA domain-containing protein n=1 Tax=Marilutibacter penaei TaxID=2759900 RepID=A0A7W3U601_9GAMM|nr:LodA/GoxA family CTQ-dependent oxidase [Lysobacter penaei]MBB1089577.1 VWA domain-containing protein [Lysobacter penaei]